MPTQSENLLHENILDDVDFKEEDASLFRQLLDGQAKDGSENKNELTVGSLLKGTIVEITKDFVVVDVGLKSEGLIPIQEFSNSEEVELGKEIEILLEQPENESGQIVLSKEKADKQRKWEYILENCKEGSLIQGKIIRKVKGGLMVDIGMEAFLPGSQIDNKRIKNLDDYLGKTFDFKILKINIERKNIVVSRRELLEEERISKKIEMLENIQVGEIHPASVKNITDFGVFLDLNGIDGLLHITDMTWKRIKHPSEMVEIGQDLEVMILSIDKEKGRVALGLKQKDQNPWEEIEQRYPPGTRVKGTIVNLLPYGAFIEIEPGIEGLIHVSEMSWVKNITDPTELVSKGEEIEAIVLSIQKQEGKISLGIKQTERNPWEEVEERYPVGKVVEAEVRNLTNYGAFVELEPGLDGLIHISDLSWTKKVSHPTEILKKNQKVNAKILTVDKESKKITLGLKQLADNPWTSLEEMVPIGSMVSGEVTKITAFGAFVELDNGMEALIHVTELSSKPFGKVEDIISKGDKLTAQVIKIDPEHKKIALSLKQDSHGDLGDDIITTSSHQDDVSSEESPEEES